MDIGDSEETKASNSSVAEEVTDLHDVTDILKANLAVQQANQKPLKFEKPKKRRTRDYILGMILVNPLIVVPYFILEQNVVTGIFTLSGVVSFSIGYTWIMWVLLDDY